MYSPNYNESQVISKRVIKSPVKNFLITALFLQKNKKYTIIYIRISLQKIYEKYYTQNTHHYTSRFWPQCLSFLCSRVKFYLNRRNTKRTRISFDAHCG